MVDTVYLRIEGVNFGNTVMDCDDLASIRGSSWALLSTPAEFPAAFKPRLGRDGSITTVFTGASIGVYRLETGQSSEAIEDLARACLSDGQNWPPDLAALLPYLTFSVAALPLRGGSYLQTEIALKNRSAIAQYQHIDLDIPDPDAASFGKPWPCDIDGMRPRAKVWEIPNSPTKEVRQISEAICQRKVFGKQGRRIKFYQEHAGLPKVSYEFADNFEEIAKEGPRPAGVPARLFGKMAVLYMDGNAFGKIRADYISSDETSTKASDFSTREIGPHREALLRGMVEHLAEDPLYCLKGKKDKNGNIVNILRMETLLWGGDENLLVFPAWGLFSVLRFLEQHLKGQKCGEANLSYAMGAVVCRHKTPIRLVAKLARDLSENAKARTKEEMDDYKSYRSYVDICALSGYEVPMEHISVTRQEKDKVKVERQPFFYPLPLDGLDEIHACLSALRGISGDESAGIPRAKLIDTLIEARDKNMGDEHSVDADEISLASNLFEDRKYTGSDGEVFAEDHFKTVVMPLFEKAPLSFLHHVVTLWDHLDSGDAA